MNKSTIALIAAIILAAAASFVLGYMTAQRHYEKAFQGADTVYVERWIRDTIYEPKDSVIYKTVTAFLPVHDTTFLTDTLVQVDSILVDVPIWEKSYASSNYHLTIRGFQPELVDIWIRQQEKIVTIPYRKRWSFTLGPQLGVGITPEGWQPYAGAGLTFGYSF